MSRLLSSRMTPNLEKDDFKAAIVSEIEGGIDNIDKLSENEVSLLMQMIQTLRLKGGSNGQTQFGQGH